MKEKKRINKIRKRLNAFLKGKGPYETRMFTNTGFDKEAGCICRLLIGHGIFGHVKEKKIIKEKR